MKLIDVAVGLGSNLDHPRRQIELAVSQLIASDFVQDLVCSSLVYSKPQGPQDQPDYVNAAVRFKTALEPLDLLAALQKIEQAQGRIKKRHWGERCIDLDILLYSDAQIEQPGLVVPHAQMTQRDFVLIPLSQVWPDAEIPGKGKLCELIKQLPQSFLVEDPVR